MVYLGLVRCVCETGRTQSDYIRSMQSVILVAGFFVGQQGRVYIGRSADPITTLIRVSVSRVRQRSHVIRGLALDRGCAHTDSGPRTLVNLEAAGGTPGGETPQNEIIDCWRCSSTFTVSCRSLWQRCVHCWFRHFWFELVMRASSSSGLVQRLFRFGSALVRVWFISGPSPEVLLRGESESLIPQDVPMPCKSKHVSDERVGCSW